MIIIQWFLGPEKPLNKADKCLNKRSTARQNSPGFPGPAPNAGVRTGSAGSGLRQNRPGCPTAAAPPHQPEHALLHQYPLVCYGQTRYKKGFHSQRKCIANVQEQAEQKELAPEQPFLKASTCKRKCSTCQKRSRLFWTTHYSKHPSRRHYGLLIQMGVDNRSTLLCWLLYQFNFVSWKIMYIS